MGQSKSVLSLVASLLNGAESPGSRPGTAEARAEALTKSSLTVPVELRGKAHIPSLDNQDALFWGTDTSIRDRRLHDWR